MFLFNDWLFWIIFFLFLLLLCFLLIMLVCENAIISTVSGCCCFMIFAVIMAFVEFNSFILFFFLVYSSFFLVIFLCVGSFVEDFNSFDFSGVVLCCCFLILLAIIDFFFIYSNNLAVGNFGSLYLLNNAQYCCIISENFDIGLIGDLLFNEFSFFVLIAGFLLFIGILCIPLLCTPLLRIQGAYLRSKNKKVVKRSLNR